MSLVLVLGHLQSFLIPEELVLEQALCSILMSFVLALGHLQRVLTADGLLSQYDICRIINTKSYEHLKNVRNVGIGIVD